MNYFLKKIADQFAGKYFTSDQTLTAPSDDLSSFDEGRDFVKKYIERNQLDADLTQYLSNENFYDNVSILDEIYEKILKALILIEDAPEEVLLYPDRYGVDQIFKKFASDLSKINYSIMSFYHGDENHRINIRKFLIDIKHDLNILVRELDTINTEEDLKDLHAKNVIKSREIRDKINKASFVISKIFGENDRLVSQPPFLKDDVKRMMDDRRRHPDNLSLGLTFNEKDEDILQKLNEALHQAFNIAVSPQTYKFLIKKDQELVDLLNKFEDDFYQVDYSSGFIKKIFSSFGEKSGTSVINVENLSKNEVDNFLNEMWKKKEISSKEMESAKLLTEIYRKIKLLDIKKLNQLERKKIFYKLANF